MEDAKWHDKERGQVSNTDMKVIQSSIALISARIGMLCYLQKVTMETINKLSVSIDKLPNEKTFDGLRAELEHTKTSAVAALLPIKQMIEENKAREKRAAEMDGYA